METVRKNTNQVFREKLKVLPSLAGLSQGSFAKAINLNQTTISRIEKGIRPVTLEEAVAVAEYFNMPLSYFTSEGGDQDEALAVVSASGIGKQLERAYEELGCLVRKFGKGEA